MSTWTDSATHWAGRLAESRRVQLFATAVFSGAVVAGTILGYQAARKDLRAKILKSSIEAPPVHDPIADKVAEYNAHPYAITMSDGNANVKQAQDADGTLRSSSLVREPPVHSESLRPSAPVRDPSSKDISVEHVATQKVTDEDDEDRRSALLAMRARQGDYDDDLILEQLARNRVFLTDEGLQRLRSSFVIIVGCGGVGSHATAALARSGVSKLRLVDFDQVTLSSLNRHAVATLADVGTPKVQCIRKRLQQVAPWVEFDCRNELFRSTSADTQLAPWDGHKPDYVVDAIDNIDSKIDLLKYCHDRSIPVISSMGAGCKSDPTRVLIGDISQSTEDPLSRSTRRRLRILGVTSGIPVVFSTEKTAPGKAQLLPLPEDEFQKGKVGELGVLPDFRVRILPVLGTMPAVFGLCVANHIMLEISGYPHDYVLSKGREKMYDSILATLQGLEERLAKWAGIEAIGLRLPITAVDVGYLVEEVYRGKSVISGLTTRLALIRWGWREDQLSFVDQQYPGQKFSKLQLNDLVCMTKEEAVKHESEVLKGAKTPADMYEPTVLLRVRERMEEELHFQQFR